MNEFRAEVEALVRRVVPDEIDNVDDIMVQFSGREEELIETLRSMQEKSIAQRARAAVQRSAKVEAVKKGESPSRDRDIDESSKMDESSEGYGEHSVTTAETEERNGPRTLSVDEHSMSQSMNETQSRSGSYSSYSHTTGSATGQYSASRTDDDDGSYTSRSSDSGSRSSGTSVSSGSSRQSDVSGMSQESESIGMISIEKRRGYDTDILKTTPGLGDAIDASDWRAVGEAAAQLTGGGSTNPNSLQSMSADMSNESDDDMLDNMIDEGNWSGIIDAASNMTSGHVQQGNSGGVGEVDSINSID